MKPEKCQEDDDVYCKEKYLRIVSYLNNLVWNLVVRTYLMCKVYKVTYRLYFVNEQSHTNIYKILLVYLIEKLTSTSTIWTLFIHKV